MRERMIEVGGDKLRLMEAGSGAPVLYLHGAGGANWYPLLEMLSESWHVLAPEHPGFGRSSIPEWMVSVGDLAFFYLDLLGALDLDGVHLVGHSLGGWTAAEIAIRNTARLKSLTLMAPAGVASPEEPFGDIFLWSPEEHARNSFFEPHLVAERLNALAGVDVDVMLQNRSGCRTPRLDAASAQSRSFRIGCTGSTFRRCWCGERRIGSVRSRATCPICARLRGAELFALPRSGHALHTERPSEVAARLAGLLRRGGAPLRRGRSSHRTVAAAFAVGGRRCHDSGLSIGGSWRCISGCRSATSI